MVGVVKKEIEDYCRRHGSQESYLLTELTKVTYEKSKHPQMLIGQLEGNLLKFIIKASKVKNILEIGTFTGYSAITMAEALPEDGKLITLDINPETTKIARDFLDKSPHGKKVEIIIGPALHTIQSLSFDFDLVFIDADKGNYISYWDECIPKLKSGGIVIVDNVLWNGQVLNPTDGTAKSISDFNDHIIKDDRVDLVMLSVRDGITLAYKR